MIRRATTLDVTAMIDVLRWGYERSIYKDKAEILRSEANRILTQAIQRHGGKGASGTWTTVVERPDKVHGTKIEGFIIGVLQPVYHVGDMCTATDLFWLTTDKASARDSVGLMLGMIDWAKAHPKAIDIYCGATGALGDWKKASGMLERMGLAQFGAIHRMEKAA